MRIHLIKELTIRTFSQANARSRTSLEDFLQKLKYANWEKPTDMADTFNGTDLLGKGSNRVIFNIGGNTYRVICKYHFGEKEVHLFVCWIGTHAEYTKLCDDKLQYTINLF